MKTKVNEHEIKKTLKKLDQTTVFSRVIRKLATVRALPSKKIAVITFYDKVNISMLNLIFFSMGHSIHS